MAYATIHQFPEPGSAGYRHRRGRGGRIADTVTERRREDPGYWHHTLYNRRRTTTERGAILTHTRRARLWVVGQYPDAERLAPAKSL